MEPALNNEEPALNNGEPALNNGEPALNNGEPALNNGEPALNNGEPALNDEEPALNNEEPALKMKERASLYSFNQEQLKFQLIKISGEIFLDHNTYMKEYSLLKFRLLHPQLPLPDLLFTYTTKTRVDKDLISNFKSVIDFYYDDNNNFKTDQYSLTNLLEKSFSFKIPYDFINASNDLQMFSPSSSPIIYKIKNDIDFTTSPELNTSFIYDYFCLSTFPSLFGHFCSAEFIHSGRNFIARHINDELSPLLVSTFLLHCTPFRDNLLSTFTHYFLNIIPIEVIEKVPDVSEKVVDSKVQEKLTKSFQIFEGDDVYAKAKELLEILYSAFVDCISYFTKDHFDVVRLLRNEDEKMASVAICNYFIREILDSWKYSPLFTENGFLIINQSVKNCTSASLISKIHLFDIAIDMLCLNSSYSTRFLDLFADMSVGLDKINYTEMPKISELIFCDGFMFTPTIADLLIVDLIYHTEKELNLAQDIRDLKKKIKEIESNSNNDNNNDNNNDDDVDVDVEEELNKMKNKLRYKTSAKNIYASNKTVINNVKDFMHYMFILVPTSVTVSKITSGLIVAPELRPFSSSNLTHDDLLKHEKFHKFIEEHASNLKHLKMCVKSTLRVLKLKEREYGLHLWKNRDKISAKIQLNHLLSTGSIVIDCSKQLLNRNEYQVNQLVSYCYSIFYGYARSKTTDSLNAYFDQFQSLISQEMLERSKVDLISEFKENINTPLKKYKLSIDEKLLNINSKYIFNAIERVSFALDLAMMDDTPHVIIPTNIPDIPDGTKISDSQLLLDIRINKIDQFINDFCPVNREVNLADCNSEILDDSMVQLQKLISIVNEKMRIEFDSMLEKFNIGQKLTLFLLIKDIIKKSSMDSRVEIKDPMNFKFFQINLINCIEVFSNYLENKINIYPNIAQKILKDLEYLCSVFHISRKKD